MLNHLPTTLRRRAVLGGAAAMCALAALPAAGQATEITRAPTGEIVVRDARSKANDISLDHNRVGNTMTITDGNIVPEARAEGCTKISPIAVRCPLAGLRLELGGGNDEVSTSAGLPTTVRAGAGDDIIKIRGGDGTLPSTIDAFGEAGTDTVDYSFTTSAVRVEKDEKRNDGRAGTADADNIHNDIESWVGSPFDDVVIGSAGGETFDGGLGNDTMSGVDGTNIFKARPTPDGADNLIGGSGFDYADYTARTGRVLLSVDGQGNDGAPGEGDNLLSTDGVMSGSGNDVLRAGSAAAILIAGAGNDFLFGGESSDYLDGGRGVDGLAGNGGNDALEAVDGELDDLLCGAGTDSARTDVRETRIQDCEPGQVGTLRAPATRVDAGERGIVRVSWTHPRSWKALKSVRIALVDANLVPVGTVDVHPRSGAVKATGAALGLRSSSVRLSHKGGTVTARIAVRPSDALAGATIDAQVQAVERSGRPQQLMRAGVLKIAG